MIADPELLKLFKAESEEHLARLDDGLLRLEQSPTDSELLEEMFRESHSLKGAARMLGLSRIELAAHQLESIFNSARKGDASLAKEAIENMNTQLVDLRRQVSEALGKPPQHPATTSCAKTELPNRMIASTPPQPPESNPLINSSHHASSAPPSPSCQNEVNSEPFHLDTVRVETCKLDDLLTQVAELSIIQGQAQHRLALLEDLLEQWAKFERKLSRHASNALADERIRFADLLKQARHTFFDDSTRLQSVAQRLGDQVGAMRLLPLSTIFALFPRMVNDQAKAQNKEIEFILEGGDITVDKRILEEMKDPLMHLIRNAIDHGIELPAERQRTGKPGKAKLRLRAVREESYVLLEFDDDGRGLDMAAIRHEAIRRGLFDEASLAGMTPQQVQQLIFTSGFSTCHDVTELSGRGVGLDVVRVNVERMKGSVQLESWQGQGLSVRLCLPLSLATTRLLLASANGQLYGIPFEFIQTSKWTQPTEIFMLDGHPAVTMAGETVIVAYLSVLLGLPPVPHTPPKPLACTVIQTNQGRLGLLTDDLCSEEEVVLKPLGAPLKRVRNVSALTILSSGEFCVVLNPSDLLNAAHNMLRDTQHESSRLNRQNQAKKNVILLAEDSALIRAMEKRILEDADYEVVTAVDGLDALNLLNSRCFAGLVTDVVMPNMDGLTLTERVRARPQFQNLPIVLVTSLASDQDKRRGLEAGANAYLPKPTFDQRMLIDTLRRLIER